MTNNIVAQFSSSIDKNGKPKEYEAVSGSIFNDEFNETLDSGVLVLDQIKKEDRLSYIKPYDFVRVFDKSSLYDAQTGTYKFDKIYLVDNFNERENNINEHIFGYSINLMSETKILEKWQCPNRIITHELDENGHVVNKTIYKCIKEAMELYVPKIKFCADGEHWSYQPLIKCGELVHKTLTFHFDRDDTWIWDPVEQEYSMRVLCAIHDAALDYETVVMNGYSVDTELVLADKQMSYNKETGIFTFTAHSQTIGEGDIAIQFTCYKYGELYDRFNVPCADLPFNFPTLRQLLTALMQQVGCIPTVRNRVLGFLDLQQEAKLFGNGDYSLNNTVNYIKRSLSSDSFVNTLVNTSEQVLDSGNEVVCETLGFRDKSNVLLRQEENLKLETSLPIYKINKCIMHAPGKESVGSIGSNAGCCFLIRNQSEFIPSGYNLRNHPWPIIFYSETEIANNTASLKFRLDEDLANPNFTINFKNIYFLSRVPKDSDMVYEALETRSLDDINLNDSVLTFNDVITFPDTPGSTVNTFSSKSFVLTFNNIPNGTVGFAFSGTFINNNTLEKKEFTFFRFDKLDTNVQGHTLWGNDWQSQSGSWTSEDEEWFSNLAIARFLVTKEIVGFKTWDITKLVVEESVRQTLETDFNKMIRDISDVESSNVDNISKYVYGTVGYSIGSKEISGFSTKYTVGSSGVSWIQRDYTYLENIVNCLEKGTTVPMTDLVYYYFSFLNDSNFYIKFAYNSSYLYNIVAYQENNFLDFYFSYYDAGTNTFVGGKKFFTSFVFDIYYQPLNSFNLAYVKSQEESDFPLEQFDSGASGVSDFDRLSTHEQEQVDRVGNEVLTISQRTNDINLVQNFNNGPLLFKDDTNRDGNINSKDKKMDYIIFKRSISINNNFFSVTYVGSKDAVLKDYFTSIRTKYRAYQYVDYNSSVLRKERDTLFVRIASSLYDGDNKIRLGNVGEKQYNDLSYLDYFIYDFAYENNDKKSICYEVEKGIAVVRDGTEGIKYETQTTKNSVSLISTNNMMAFVYENSDNVGAGTYLRDITNDQNLGGIPQTWQIWGNAHNEAHKVLFANNINFYIDSKPVDVDSEDEIKEEIAKVERSPLIDDFNYSTVFWICDDNTDNDSKRAFYKDVSERINHTVQFIYYAPNKDVLLSDHFISGTPMIGRHEISYNACYYSNNFKLNELPHDVPEGDIRIGTNCISIEEVANIPYVQVAFNNRKVVKMCYYDEETGKVTDIAVFKNSSETVDYQNFYFMINDTKSDYVLADYHGVLYRKYKVSTYVEPDSGTAGYVPVSDLFPRTVEQIYNEED